jgi:hypothetical protein
MQTFPLGATVTDQLTGFRGVVTGFVYYISGCNQALVQPRVKSDGDFVESQWFDAQRLVVDDTVPAVTLDNGPTPGADRSPPKR